MTNVCSPDENLCSPDEQVCSPDENACNSDESDPVLTKHRRNAYDADEAQLLLVLRKLACAFHTVCMRRNGERARANTSSSLLRSATSLISRQISAVGAKITVVARIGLARACAQRLRMMLW
eukprot:5466728-Pleurochrysis_carterae.AAC.1